MVPQFFKYNLWGRIMGDGTPISQVQSLGDGTYRPILQFNTIQYQAIQNTLMAFWSNSMKAVPLMHLYLPQYP